MLDFSTTPPADAPERPREVLFRIDGVPYTVPTTFEPIEMARYAFMVSEWGADAAAVWALQFALGSEPALKFMNLPYGVVSKEAWTQVIGLVTGRLVGLDVALPKEPVPAAQVLGDTGPGGTNPEQPDKAPELVGGWPETEPSEAPTSPAPAP